MNVFGIVSVKYVFDDLVIDKVGVNATGDVSHDVDRTDGGLVAVKAPSAAKVDEYSLALDKAGVFYRFADERDLASRERPQLLIVPSEEKLDMFEDFPRVEYEIPADIRNFSVVQEKGESGCFLLPVKRPEGEGVMIFNPDGEEKVFTFENKEHYSELPPPDRTYTAIAPVISGGGVLHVPLHGGALRIFIKNGKPLSPPECTAAVTVEPRWQITRVEKLKMSRLGPTFFQKKRCSQPLPPSGDYTELDGDFSGFITVESLIQAPVTGKAYLCFEKISCAASCKVNGREAGFSAVPPRIFEAELKKGENRLQLRIASSAGNEFVRCFREELEPVKWVNSYARRFLAFERDDKECGVAGALKIIFVKE